MTPLPKRRISTRRQGKRRVTLTVVTKSTTLCPNCSTTIIRHQVCPNCGQYRKLQINNPITTKP